MNTRRSPSAVTLEDVAKMAGVSRATVSRVVNGTRNVDIAIQDAVRQAIEKTGYSPNRAARSLVTRRTDAVALVVSGSSGDVFADPFFGRVVGGVVGYLRDHHVHALLMLADDEITRADVLHRVRQGDVDGVLVVNTDPEDPMPAMLRIAGLPAVGFSRTAFPLPFVDVRHREGGRMAARHLLERGRLKLATISGPRHVPASQNRIRGFRDIAGERVPNARGNFTMASGEEAMDELLEEYSDINGVFVANDLMAQGALVALRENGLNVPGDVAVVGFDDSSAALASRPKLTTIRQPVEEMGAAMAQTLLEHVRNPDSVLGKVMFEPELVIRDSS
ncbi:LacI family DNA-binding transcriptional regulator [Actinophytocola sp. NPDC049390]|uniref:LacI family DNA-binding transcriptional regulator n=1 Tax=Actinophytocola sp. NPDC049390 TaxID=3363894 RepID=UPI0037AF6D5B